MKFVLVIVFFVFNNQMLFADEITLASDLWCPYACEVESKSPGFMVEIAREVFQESGHRINYKLVNWARAIADAKEGKIDGIIGASRPEVPHFFLPSIENGHNADFFWGLKDSSWTFNGISSLKGKKIGVINGYTYGNDEINKLMSDRDSSFFIVSGDDALLKIIKMTKAKRLDSFIENPYVLSFFLRDKPEIFNKLKMLSKNIGNDSDLFIAFSPKNPKSKHYAELLSTGMEKMRKSGRLKIILQKYGLKDWK